MSLKTVVVLAIVIVAGAVGDTLVSKGMKQIGEIHSADPASLARVALRALRQPYVMLGALCLAIYFFSFLAVLSWADVSLVVPITSLSFLLTTFLAQWALHERVTPLRWAGTLLILAGVALVARSGSAEGTGPRAAVTAAHVSHPEAGGEQR
jgi:drug/metabolite transporter (DMT)-like permease